VSCMCLDGTQSCQSCQMQSDVAQRCNIIQDIQDVQDAENMSLASGCNTHLSDTGSVFADVENEKSSVLVTLFQSGKHILICAVIN